MHQYVYGITFFHLRNVKIRALTILYFKDVKSFSHSLVHLQYLELFYNFYSGALIES